MTANQKPTTACSEIKIKCLIIDIEKRLDKNGRDYWIIRTKLGDQSTNYLAFSADFNLSPKTRDLLTDYPHRIVNNWVLLTIKKKDDFEKVINLEMQSMVED